MNGENRFWNKLIKLSTLKQGWYLAQVDLKKGFIVDKHSIDAYANNFNALLLDIRNRLITDYYESQPLQHIEIPKGNYGIRPGTLISIDDSVVLFSIVYLIAPIINKKLSENVYSFKTKKNLDTITTTLFEDDEDLESPFLDYPFLSEKTISKNIDPFESWYMNWPKFDKASMELYKDGYNYMAKSDISAYFENIQLPILRDQMLQYLPSEHRIVNLLCSLFERWAFKTNTGRIPLRGIPQGNNISRFLGNLFLIPLDDEFNHLERNKAIKYLRYHDDTRVFARDKKTAKEVLKIMDAKLRQLHLNTQSAKTKIYEKEEIEHLLLDERLSLLDEVSKEIDDYKGEVASDEKQKNKIKKKLSYIYKKTPKNPWECKIQGARSPLKDLSSRVFRRLISQYFRINDSSLLPRLVSEIKKNPVDDRLYKLLIVATRNFPNKNAIQNDLFPLIRDKELTFPYQEAEIIRSFKYLSEPSEEVVEYCKRTLLDPNCHYYLRVQCASLLTRLLLEEDFLRKCEHLLNNETYFQVQSALIPLLMQMPVNKHLSLIERATLHPNINISRIGASFRTYRNDYIKAATLLGAISKNKYPWLMCDYSSYLFCMAGSTNSQINTELVGLMERQQETHTIRGLRPLLNEVLNRTIERNISIVGRIYGKARSIT